MGLTVLDVSKIFRRRIVSVLDSTQASEVISLVYPAEIRSVKGKGYSSTMMSSPRRTVGTIIMLMIGTRLFSDSLAFSPVVQQRPSLLRRRQKGRCLFMSDVPKDDETKKPKKPKPPPVLFNKDDQDHWWKLPPAPEDQFVLIGDLLSLSVYGITDHLVCQSFSHYLVSHTDQHQLFTDMVADSDATLHAPVWWEAGSPQAANVLQATLESHMVAHYSPLLEPMGQATTLLAAAWLLAGWFHRAFLFQNTLECPTDQALTVTARTWLTTCVILFGLVGISQALMGGDVASFERGDVDYIVDSLTVLVLWRFMASWLLGGGGSSSK
jgi:hypothetical protein